MDSVFFIHPVYYTVQVKQSFVAQVQKYMTLSGVHCYK